MAKFSLQPTLSEHFFNIDSTKPTVLPCQAIGHSCEMCDAIITGELFTLEGRVLCQPCNKVCSNSLLGESSNREDL